MSTFNPNLPGSAPAAADFSASTGSGSSLVYTNQYRGVVRNSSGQIAIAGAGVQIIGVLQNAPIAGDPARYDRRGIQKVKLGGTVVAGAKLATNASGDFVTAASGNYAAGNACSAGVAGDIISMDFQVFGPLP